MKDVLINLQLTLINTLRSVYMDGIDLDFQVLLTASDDSRVNAAVCLGQLSQRLSDAAKAQAYYPPSMSMSSSSYSSPASAGRLMPPMSPSLGYSSSRSTQSSASAVFMGPRTPDPEKLDNFGLTVADGLGRSYGKERGMGGDEKSSAEKQSNLWASLALPFESRVTEALPLPVGGHHQGNQRTLALPVLSDDSDTVSLRRRSSQALAPDDNILLLFPQPGGRPHPCRKETEPDRNEKTVHHRYSSSSSTAGSGHTYHSSSPDISHTNQPRTRNSRDRYGPDDYGEHVHQQQQQHGYDQHQQVESPVVSDAAAYRTDGRQYSHSTIYDMYQPQQPLTPEKQVSRPSQQQQRPMFSSAAGASPLPYVQRAHNVTVTIQHADAREGERVRQLQETSRPPRPQQQPRSDSLNALRNPETRVDDQTGRAGLRPVRLGHVLGRGARQHSAPVGTHAAAISSHDEFQSHSHPLPLSVRAAERQPREPPSVPLPQPPTQAQPPRQQYRFMPHSSTPKIEKQQQQHQTQQQKKSNNTTMSDSKSHSRPTSTSTSTTTFTTTPRPLPPAQRPDPPPSSSLLSPATDINTTGNLNNLLESTSTAPISTISNSNSRCLSTTTPMSTPISIPTQIHIPLTLPTDKDLLGFCKGAFRLQAGMERKAFGLANRPSGLSGMITYWKCEKCNFEGPAPVRTANAVSGTASGETRAGTGTGETKKSKQKSKQKPKVERIFDPKIRVSEGGGVRYKWAFLARCHVAVKAVAMPVPQASTVLTTTTATTSGGGGGGRSPNDIFGSFGCIFCCAEGRSRGWLENNLNNREGEGVLGGGGGGGGGSTTSATPSSTPIFGNVSSFMHHLETVHVNRGPDGWPCAEMVGRFRVVFGDGYNDRDTEGSSGGGDWEVKFVPRLGSSSSLSRS
ncbi:hypothetical protein HRR83_001666 [Exophiala dermatitidis]|nr:hypothetical protein HRR73_004800 [Exophiala dermatitidis]KAJ4526472.1 hypothetical protein HRR74_001670 [Exophiala dermatitidis]KAJ4532282.1 hypothetical protein HRR76_007280 [Exophiala dermatitidis]KAJ4546319.1 hypothetical protein HRR77_004854 [Exophiala dermatitidis]KAJ4567437.1 hypothetical protein HRR79_004954 [Exophiala dermatitidis]